MLLFKKTDMLRAYHVTEQEIDLFDKAGNHCAKITAVSEVVCIEPCSHGFLIIQTFRLAIFTLSEGGFCSSTGGGAIGD